MDESREILLTNDDGIDAVGLRALYEDLSEIADVTVVAPADDQSAVGRLKSHDVLVEDRDGEYAIRGTPVDCVIAGLEELCPDPDLVVAGCNRGANLGGYVLGRSGTVSAAVEAALFDVPAIATSLYVPVGETEFEDVEPERWAYRNAVEATRYLVRRAPAAGVFEHADYLNVNAPVYREAPAPMRVTRPSDRYEMAAVREGDQLRLHDRIWDLMAEDAIDEPPDVDRGAVLDGAVSVSPLTAPHTASDHGSLAELAADYTTE